jgi:hypothetical protein
MSFINVLEFVLFCVGLGNLDCLIEEYQSRGNMGLAGACLDIYYKRNACYVSFTILIISIIANHWEIASGMGFMWCVGIFLYSVVKWMPFLIKSEEEPLYMA